MNVFGSVFLMFAIAVGGWSQAQMSAGDIHGRVLDPDGALVTGVSVTIRHSETRVNRTTATDQDGTYRFFLLNPGIYELRFESSGFAIQTRRPIQLQVGQSLNIDARLTPVELQQEIVVIGPAPFVELEKTQQADTITQFRVDNLPINRREFLDFSLLTPGVTDSKALITFSLPQTPNSGLSFAGQSGRSNSVTIDGVDNNDNAVATVRSTLSQEAVQEFQINRSNYSAEFGRAAGGLINIVSRSGTNDVTGTMFAFLRDQALDARNPFAFGPGGTNIDPPFSRLQSGFSLGGSIVRNRSFFFLSYEGLRQRESNFTTFLESEELFKPTASQEALIQALSVAPVPSFQLLGSALRGVLTTSEEAYPETIQLLRENSGVFPFRNSDNRTSLRIDHQATGGHQLFLRTSFSDVDTIGGSFGGLKGPSRGVNQQIQDFGLAFGESYFLDSNRVNEFRFQFAQRQFNSIPADPFGPEININGTALLGRDYFLPSIRTEKRFQWIDNFTLVLGDHEVKLGGDFHYLPINTKTEVFFGSRFIFGEIIPLWSVIDRVGGFGTSATVGAGLSSMGRADLLPALSKSINSLQAFNLGLPLAYQQGFGDPVANLTNKLAAAYVQDKFRISPSLTLNLGLRYDVEFQPTPLHRDTNNIAPRLGLAYSPDQRTVIRGGYGIYYAPVYQAVVFIERVLDGTQIAQLFVPLTGLPQLGITTTSAQIWGLLKQQGIVGSRQITAADIAPLGLDPGVTPPVLLRSAPDLVNPYSQQVSVGVERELGTDITASIGYLMNRGTKLLRSRNTNLRVTGSNAFGPTFGPVDPSVLQDNQVESSGNSIYHGLTATARKRFSDFYEFQASYTMSKAIDDTVDFITDLQAANQLDFQAERSLSAFDQRHRLVVSGVFSSPFERGFGSGKVLADLTMSPILTFASGRPFNLLMGFDANGDTNANTDRPTLAGRNTGRGPDFFSFDLRVTKAFVFRGHIERIEVIAEGFNLFNRVNYSGVNNVVGTSLNAFDVEGDATRGATEPLGFTSAFAPRQIQVGLRLRF